MRSSRLLEPPSSTWGRATATIGVGGECLELRGLTESQAATVGGRYEGAPNSSLQRTTVSWVTRGSVPTLTPGRFDAGGVYTPEARYAKDGLEFKGCGFSASIALNGTCHGWLQSADEELTTQPIVLENYLRVLTAYTALREGGLLLHCSAVVTPLGAHLFLGRSGAGKTTLARTALAEGFEVLSDDAALVLPAEHGFDVGYVPFAGELGDVCKNRHTRYPIVSASWLVQGRALRVGTFSPADRHGKTLTCCPFVNADPYRLPVLMETIDSFNRSHPIRSLHLRRGDSFTAVAALLETQENDRD